MKIVLGVALLVVFSSMASAMGGNGPGSEDMTIAADVCSDCHRTVEGSYIPTHHPDETVDCLGCHVPDGLFVAIPECDLCHTNGLKKHHPLPGNECVDCHSGNQAANEDVRGSQPGL